MLQHHRLFPTVVSTAHLSIDPLQQAIVLKALLALRGDAEAIPMMDVLGQEISMVSGSCIGIRLFRH